MGWAQPSHPPPKSNFRLKPVRAPSRRGGRVREERRRDAEVRWRLVTVHPNPGPHGRSQEEKRRRRERRYRKRRERREVRARQREEEAVVGGVSKEELVVVAWNVQRMSVGNLSRRKMKMVATMAESSGWDVVLLSEVWADGRGIVWLGQAENLVAVLHSERAGVLLRGEALKRWCEGGQRKKWDRRHVSVKVQEWVLVATYMPVKTQGNEVEIEEEREVLLQHIKWAEKGEVVVVGGDFNAHIGGGEQRSGVCGGFGLRRSNEQGEELKNWCEENGLCWVNGFYSDRRRGTWWSNFTRRWYELDGFVMRREERHKFVKKVKTVGEMTISDHKPKKVVLDLRRRKKWRREYVRRRTPVIRWERLKEEEVERRYASAVERKMGEREEEEVREDTTGWTKVQEVVLEAAKEVCGEAERRVDSPWMVGKEEEARRLRGDIGRWIERRDAVVGGEEGEEELARAREGLKVARKLWKREVKRWEKEWWESELKTCEEAAGRGDSGAMYKSLRRLGERGVKRVEAGSILTKEEFREHFKKVSEERFENVPEEVEKVIDLAPDLRRDVRTREWRERLGRPPERAEVEREMRKMKDASPGEDGVRLGYLLKGGEKLMAEVVRIVRFMWGNGAETWEDLLRSGVVVPLFKKGDRNNPGNYRGVCLLSMGSRIVARIVACRLREWAEAMGLMDDNQAGFRSGRSTADATQMMVRVQEDAEDLKRRRERAGGDRGGVKPAARLLDLRKAYPRVNKPGLWRLLERCGLEGDFLRVIVDLHEGTEYAVRGKEGNSESWVPERGLREGCPSSPILFNIFHQAVMRVAVEERRKAAEVSGKEVGVCFSWVPGSALPGERLWEKKHSEAVEVWLELSLFADDTTVVGDVEELEEGVEVTKKVMSEFEEKNNDDKEESLVFGSEESGDIRMLGCWMGWRADVEQRLARGRKAWWKMRNRLRGSRMSRKLQARVVEACVESGMLFDCQVRVWQAKEVRRMQVFVDRCYRQVWSRRTGPPLVQMEREGKNMADVRRELGVRTLRWKIEKRVLERIGHVLRMEDERMTKAVVLGWMKELERWEKPVGRRRKTVSYWKKLLREAGIDWTDLAEVTKDRKGWKRLVKVRMERLDKWEKCQGHKWVGERVERNERREAAETGFECKVCRKVCKSKGGLTVHRRRMHEVSVRKKEFKCEDCEEVFGQEANMLNHRKVCSGVVASSKERRKCACGKEYSKTYFPRHRRVCPVGVEEVVQERPRVYRGKRVVCVCGVEMAATNLARHKREVCPYGEAGP